MSRTGTGRRDYGPGCERHAGDPHNLCFACWELEPDKKQGPGPTRFDLWPETGRFETEPKH